MIDLTQLPAPALIEGLDFEQILAGKLESFKAIYPDWSAALESDPVMKLLELSAYDELMVRARINEAGKAVMLAYATGADLEQIAARFNVQRQLMVPADETAKPPVPAIYEDDASLRRRVQMAFEGFSTAGPAAAYVFHALSAHPDVKDVSVSSPTPGRVLVTIQSVRGNGVPSLELLGMVRNALQHEDVRPLTDEVVVQPVEPVPYRIEARIYVRKGPDASVVKQAATAALDELIASTSKIGEVVSMSAIYGALHQPGAYRVELFSPTADVAASNLQVPWCSGYAVGVEVG